MTSSFYTKLFNHVKLDAHVQSIYKISKLDTTTFNNTIMTQMSYASASQFCLWYLSHIQNHIEPSKCIVVFDIDDTLIKSMNDKALQCVIDLYHLCQSYGFVIYVITARVDEGDNKKYTSDQLKLHDIHVTSKHLILRPKNQTTKTFKEQARASISKRKKIILTLGDQITDIGNDCGLGILLK